MSLNNKGFMMIEVIISSSIIFLFIIIFIPAISMIETERKVLTERRWISSTLHDELQHYLAGEDVKSIVHHNYTHISLTFKPNQQYIQGCASWKNVKNKDETFCLYGFQK